ncbi:MAG TPA: thioesterase family protein [Aeromicrobium sp.]|nr:thioesterase family protein [Aeromicrobium sp.]
MADVDAAGIIYYASALRWAERLSTNWMRSIGYPYSRLFAESIATPAVSVKVDYHSHINLDDSIRLDLSVAHIGTSSFTFRTEIFVGQDEAPAVAARVTHVFARYEHPSQNPDKDGAHSKATPIPERLRSALEAGYRPKEVTRRP